MTRKGDPSTLRPATRGMRSPVAPNAAQRAFNGKIPGQQQDGLRRAQQIARQRQQTPYVRQPVWCVSCLGPRDPRKGPVCPECTAKRKAGQR